MKIALVIEHFDRSRGGAENYLWELAQYLIASGHEVHLYAQDVKGVIAGVVFHPVVAEGATKTRRLLSFARNVEKSLAHQSFDVIHGVARTFAMDVFQPHGGTIRGSLNANIRAEANSLCRSVKRLSFLLSPKVRLFLKIERKQFSEPLPEKIIALSKMVRSHMCTFYKVPEERLTLLYNGVDTERFHPGLRSRYRDEMRKSLGISEETLTLLLVAHNFKLKGLGTLVRALPLLAACPERSLPAARLRQAGRGGRPIQAVVVGGGKARPYERLARSLGVRGKVTFAGRASSIEKFYAMADIYCHPTFYDPCSLVVLEALASGLPVITSRMNGVSELITNGEDGFVLEDPADFSGVARCIISLSDEKLRSEMSLKARLLAEANSSRRHFEALISLYREVAEEKRRK